jgi:hypothetical protein
MKRNIAIAVIGSLLLLAAGSQAYATRFNLTISGAAGLPVGDFGKKTDIIEAGFGGYSALGGAAEAGFGFSVELEVEATSRVFIGGRFGYSRHDADATDIMETLIQPAAPEVEDVEALWTLTGLGVFCRVVAVDLPTLDLYGRLDMGAVGMKNTFDVVSEMAADVTTTLTSDFDMGNQFFFAGGVGAEYRIHPRFSLVGELRITHVLSDGAEATSSFGQYSFTGIQEFDTQVLDIMIGVRIPLSGI